MRRHDNCQNARTCHEAGYAEGFADAEQSIRPRFATPSDGTLMGDLAHAYELGGWIGVAALVESRLAEERATTGRLRGWAEARIDLYADAPHNEGCEGEPECAACWVADLRAALASPGEGE